MLGTSPIDDIASSNVPAATGGLSNFKVYALAATIVTLFWLLVALLVF